MLCFGLGGSAQEGSVSTARHSGGPGHPPCDQVTAWMQAPEARLNRSSGSCRVHKSGADLLFMLHIPNYGVN